MSGQKVTSNAPFTMNVLTTTKASDSQAKPKLEGAGIITSDSLAAESLNSGGDFGSTTNAAAMSVPSSSSTANTPDTSAATVLAPAVDAEARQATEAWDADRELDAGRTKAPPAAAKLDGPKGRDLDGDGIVGNPPNASFTTEIGTRKDPGRVAVQDILRGGPAGGGGAGISRDGQFDSLKDAEA